MVHFQGIFRGGQDPFWPLNCPERSQGQCRGQKSRGPPEISSCEYLCEFSKNLKIASMGNSGYWGKLIHDKAEVENLVSDSL